GPDRDRLAGLALEAAEQAADYQGGGRPLLGAVEPRQVAPEEGGQAVPAAADLVGRQDRVGQQGLSIGVVQERQGGPSLGCHASYITLVLRARARMSFWTYRLNSSASVKHRKQPAVPSASRSPGSEVRLITRSA